MSASVRISVLGLDRRFRDDGAVISRLVSEVASEPKAILGPRVEQFESCVAARLKVPHAIATSSGTGAILACLRAAGIGPGTRVALPAFGHIAPAAAIVRLGAEPVFVDVRDEDLTLDPRAFAAVAAGVDAVIPVHQFAALADLEAIAAIARESKVFVLEDSAVALGAGWVGRAAGTAGDAGVFSFHPVKVFGTVGDAGMVVTKDERLASALRRLRNHGQGAARFHYEALGFNTRMDEILAGHLLARWPRLEPLVQRRVELMQRYREGLGDLSDVRLPAWDPRQRLAYAMTIRSPKRERIVAQLGDAGIETFVQYPVPLPRCAAFARHPQAEASFPVSERACSEIITLPLYPELGDAEADEVIGHVRRACH
jgi:dTDP-4-amino-4,6-dideoxygalactose transaminase